MAVYHGRPMRKLFDWVVTLGAAVAFVLVFEAEIAKPFRIPSGSMETTLLCAKPGADCTGRFNDRVIANRLAYRFGDPRRGQIVVFQAPKDACGVGGTFVKRLIGLPGDVVSEKNGFVSVNGTRLHEPYVQPDLRDHITKTWRVPAGRYFFMGDDRANSCDSRTWGAVPRSSLVGPVQLIYWPPTRWHWF
jgi:signal peptidase I